MTQDGTSKDDVKVPEGDLGSQIQADFDEGKDLLVTIVSAMGEEQVCLYIPLHLIVLGTVVSCVILTHFLFIFRLFRSRRLLKVLSIYNCRDAVSLHQDRRFLPLLGVYLYIWL
jgi:hypothetical protein